MRTINEDAKNLLFDANNPEIGKLKGFVTFGPDCGSNWWTWCPYSLRKKIHPSFEEHFESNCDYFGGWKIEIEACAHIWYECLFSDIDFWKPYFSGEKRLTQKVLKEEAARADDVFHDKIVKLDDELEAQIQGFCDSNDVKSFEWELFEHYCECWHFTSFSLQYYISRYWDDFKKATRDYLLGVAETNSCVEEFLEWEKEVRAEKEEQERKEKEEQEKQERQQTAFKRLLDRLRAYEKGLITTDEFGALMDEMILEDGGFNYPFRFTLQAVKWGIVSPPPVVSFVNE